MISYTRFLLTIVCSAFVLISCQKELSVEFVSSGGSTNGPGTPGGGTGGNGGGTEEGTAGKTIEETKAKMLGDWNFVNINVKSDVSAEFTILGVKGKVATLSHYITKDNAGTMKVTATDFEMANLSYLIDTTVKMVTYMNNKIESTDEVPFYYSASPYTGSAPYKLVTADSIYFPGGALIDFGGTTAVSQNSGGKVRFLDDKMIITTRVYETKTETEPNNGLKTTTTTSALAIITLKK